MKLVKKFAVTVLFVSVLAVPTFAGDMQTPAKSDPPPDGSSMTTTTTNTTATGSVGDPTDESYSLLYEAYLAMLGLY